jgi:predicted DNA-binding transcriptional regulator AlpA
MPVVEGVAHVSPTGWLDTKQAAVYLGLSPRTLANMRSRRTGPKYFRRGSVRYRQVDLDSWLEAEPHEQELKE